jgi:hypothetical protein
VISVVQLGQVDYGEGLRLQRKLIDLRKAGEIGDVLLLLEHSPVITLGRKGRDNWSGIRYLISERTWLRLMVICVRVLSRTGASAPHKPARRLARLIMFDGWKKG